MKQFKRFLALALSAALALGMVLIPNSVVVEASEVSSQTGAGSEFHPFRGTEALIRETIEELAALGITQEAAQEDKALAQSVENASDMTYQEARSAVFGALTADFGAGQADVSALGLDESVMRRLVESVLRDNYLAGVFTDMSYTTEDGKVTTLNFSVREGFLTAMQGIAGEMQVDLSGLTPEYTPDAAEETEETKQTLMPMAASTFALENENARASTCTNHTVGGEIIGDFNENGEVTIADVQRFRNLFASDELPDDIDCDFNENGEVTIADVQRFRNMFANDELPAGEPGVTFTWNMEPVKDSTPIRDDEGNVLNGGLLYDHETGEVSQGILPNVYYQLESVSFYCSVCHQHIVIDRSTEDGAAALDDMMSAQDVWINTLTYETQTCDAGTDPGLNEDANEDGDNDWMLYTEMEVAFFTDDSFQVAPVTDADGNAVIGEDGNPVYAPVTDADGNVIGLYATGEDDSMDNGAAEVAYYYSILSSFINDKAAYFGTPTDFWTSMNSESNPMAALKFVCNVDPETPVPPAQMTMMVRDLPQAFMAYYWQYGDVLVAMRNAAIEAMPDGLSEAQQILFLHDWLAENAWFDMGAMTAKDENGNPASSDPIQMTTFGALLSNQLRDSYDANGDGETEGYYGALCPGYAAAFNLLVQAANPDVYQTEVTDVDGNTTTRWATVEEVDARGGDLVDFVQVLFYTNTAETSIAGEGFGGGWFNNVHYFSAVKLESPDKTSEGVDADGNAWYYVDACYDDIYIECMQQYRGESDGSVDHTYFLLSPQTCATLYGDNVERIVSLYDGYVYNQTDEKYEEGDDKYNPDDPDHLKYEKVETDSEFMYDDESYQDSWFSGAISKVYFCDDGYVYYVDGGASAASYADLMDQMGDMGDSEQGEGMSMDSMIHGTRVDVEEQDLLKRRLISDPDFWVDEDEDSENSLFSSKEDPYAQVIFDYGTGEIYDYSGDAVVKTVVLADEVVEDFTFNEQYPALTHALGIYDGKIYFNLSNDIYVCNTDGTDVKLFKEYNTVNATSDGRLFTATSYTLDENGTDLSVTNHPIGAICVRTAYAPEYMQVEYNGQMVNVFTGLATTEMLTVNIATNYSFTSAGTDVDADQRYTVEAVNFNPDYQLYGEKEEGENDNAEFMWCAVIRDEIVIDEIVTTGGTEVQIPETCTRPAYTDIRTSSGVITDRKAVEGSAPTGHHYVYNETEGVYICEDCSLHSNVKIEAVENGTVSLYAISSNGMEGFEGGEYGEDVIPVSPFREAETKDSGEIEIICEADEDYRLVKVEYKYESTVATEEDDGYTEIPVNSQGQYLLEKESGCVSIRVTFEQTFEITVPETDNGTVEVIGIAAEETEDQESTDTVYLAAAGEEINLSVKPAEGYELAVLKVSSGETEIDVNEPAEDADEAVTHSFVMPEGDVTITAVFVKDSTVTILDSDNGTLTVTVGEKTVSSGDTIAEGETVTIVAEPTTGYTAAPAVTYEETVTDEDGTETTETKNIALTPVEGQENTYTFVMPACGITIDGGFTAVDYQIEKVVTPENGGTADVLETAHVGDTVTISVEAAEGYEFVSVEVSDGTETTITVAPGEEENTYTFTMPAADVTVTVTFKEVTYDVTVADTTNGSAKADKEAYAAGETVTISVTPDEGYEIDSVVVSDEGTKATAGEAENTYTFTMPAADVTVTVTFKEKVVAPIEYSITNNTLATDGSVTITVNGEEASKATAGTEVKVTAAPTDTENKEVDEIIITYGTSEIKIANGGTFEMPESDVTVTVTFKDKVVEPTQYKITANVAATDGTVSITVDDAPVESAAAGTEVKVTAAPNDPENKEVDTITITYGEKSETIENGGTFTMPDSEVTVTVTFKDKAAATDPTDPVDPET